MTTDQRLALNPFADDQESFPALAGCAPASWGRRIAARLLDSLLAFAVGFVLALPIFFAKSASGALLLSVACEGAAFLVSVLAYIYLGKTGFLPGGRIMGIRQVRVTNGLAPGWSAILKYLVFGLVSGMTVGISVLVTIFITKAPLRRTWADKLSGLVSIDIRNGRDPVAEGTPLEPADEPRTATISGSDQAIVAVGGYEPPPTLSSASSFVSGPESAAEFTQLSASVATPVAGPDSRYAPGPNAPVGAAAPVVPVVDDGAMITGVPWMRSATQGAPVVSPAPMPTSYQPSATPVSTLGDEGEGHTMLSTTGFGAAPAGPFVTLIGDDGTAISADRVTILGRNPAATALFEGARLISLEDPSMSISKTHVVIGPDSEGVWVQDLHSTNGTAVTTASGMRTAVPAGGRLVAAPGATIHVGRRPFRVVER